MMALKLLSSGRTPVSFTATVLGLCVASAVYAGDVPGNTVSEIIGVNADLCLGIKGSSTSDGALLQSQKCSGSSFQQWKVVKDSSGYAEIINQGSGQCLDVPGGSSEEGKNLQQWSCSGADNQKWNISDQGNSQYAIISKSSGLAVDVSGASKANGARIIQWKWSGKANQKWTFPSAGATGTSDGVIGFGAGTTGGAGGQVVTVSTPDELKNALCGSSNGNGCTDTTKRIIKVDGLIDFRTTEGKTTAAGCTYSDNNCSYQGKQERILDWSYYCDGRQKYNITYDTAGKNGLLVGSNKTVIGVGAYSGIKGKGLRLTGGVSNIIIRNLSITDINDGIIWAGDAITLDNTKQVWIDHNYFARIGRQMIVSGYGTASKVTISNNYFDGTTDYGHYCNQKHYWVMLLLGDNQSITLASNQFHNTSGRSPKVGKPGDGNNGGVVHMVNNYYDSNFHYGLTTSPYVYTVMEGNYYDSGDHFYPVSDGSVNTLFAPLDSTINTANSACSSVLGRECQPNYDANSPKDFTVKTSVLSQIKQNSNWLNAIRSVKPLDYSKVSSQSFGPKNNISF